MATSLTRFVTSRLAKETVGPGAVPLTDAVYRTALRTSTDTKSGSSNPGWRQRIKACNQAGTPYSRSWTLNGCISGIVSGDFHSNVAPAGQRCIQKMYGTLFLDDGPSVPLSPSMAHLDVQAKVNFIKKCRSAQRAFQGGVFLGELREAIHMIIRPASALRKNISAYSAAAKKAIRRSKGPSRARAMSGTWLEWSYGWKPLFKDIDDGMSALAFTDTLVPEVIAATAKDEWTTAFNTYSTQSTAGAGFIACQASVRTRAKGFVRYLGGVAWESQNTAPSWQSKWGLTLSDFAPTLWELIPYSFLVDYFSNVGAVIDAASYGIVRVRWGVTSSMVETSQELGHYKPYWTSSSCTDTHETASLGLSPLSRIAFSRGLFTWVNVGINDISFQIPGIGDWRKWANMAALAIDKRF